MTQQEPRFPVSLWAGCRGHGHEPAGEIHTDQDEANRRCLELNGSPGRDLYMVAEYLLGEDGVYR